MGVCGAGAAGRAGAVLLAARGAEVEVFDRGEALGAAGCSWYAGGMLAPWCELERAPPLVARLGAESLDWWRRRFPATRFAGSLVVAQGRDRGELGRFAARTRGHAWLDAEAIGALEPDLAGRFGRALHFAAEAHLDPRAALGALEARRRAGGVPVRWGCEARARDLGGTVLDCTGLAAREALADLRGVKGEMLIVRLGEIALSRPVRVLHPRVPVYVVPRGDGVFMIGATMIESDQASRISARSLLELLGAAYALHPAFGEAEVLEIGTGVRPAFADNLPRIRRRGRIWYVNGLYRHGFLLAPALAVRAAQALLEGGSFPEVMDETDTDQRRLA